MFNQLIKKASTFLNRKRFEKVARMVRNTSPVSLQYSDDLVFVSQVYHNAIDMSLLALKSFAKHMPYGRFELIDDGSLTQEDYGLLKKHLVHVDIIHIKDIHVGKCPNGGCWERLIHIINLSKNAYVVQVDTDTLTLSPMPEVFDFISKNTAFTIGNPMWPKPTSVDYMSTVAKNWNGTHVQVKTEEQLSDISSVNLNQYLRGCAAFTGFPKGVLNFDSLESLSQELEAKLGRNKWHEWGSEQVCSNIMISCCDEAEILPWPKYMNFGFPKTKFKLAQDTQGIVSVMHFIGSNRYDRRFYEKLANKHV
ncbi:hypothetical protein BIZ37_16455 [Photobacterium sp. BZF1]|uniref:hypothetical protein n=1 Tax=Photobacterium sp. BZF1 TaxID=1904457 RepID=UPI00165381F6|nr:hypothetical protein [Photobacterium sp. BZF1]MBC7004156.1 hypothetical protein [Photobacterium sp. BZF1]